jgi:hypothetical protein
MRATAIWPSVCQAGAGLARRKIKHTAGSVEGMRRIVGVLVVMAIEAASSNGWQTSSEKGMKVYWLHCCRGAIVNMSLPAGLHGVIAG